MAKETDNPWVIELATVLIGSAIFFWALVFYVRIPHLGEYLSSGLFIPHHNGMGGLDFNNIPVQALFFSLIILSSLTAPLFHALCSRGSSPLKYFSKSLVLRIGFLVFFLYLCLQTTSQTYFFYHFLATSPPTTEEKLTHYSNLYYLFPEHAKKILPGKHHCVFLNDWPKDGNPITLGIILKLRYYLYPIDISLQKDRPADCAIMMYGQDPPPLPKGFRVLSRFNDHCLIAGKE
jgi:hypothetical protein